MMTMRTTDYWRPGTAGLCWVCGAPCDTVYLDLGFQHHDCGAAPEWRMVRGVQAESFEDLDRRRMA